MEKAQTKYQYHQGFPKGLSWVPSYFYCTSMTCPPVCSLKFVFVDDTAVYLTVHGQEDAAKLQNDLDILQE